MCVPTQAELVMVCLSKLIRKQRGAALILLVFILAIAMTTYILKTSNSESMKAEREQTVTKNLAEAKEALIAWAVSNSDHFGQLPYPDRRETTTPNYDGYSDCGGDIINNKTFLIGQLPIYGQTTPCVLPQRGLGVNTLSWQGHRLWYAVSINLVHNHLTSSDPIINPDIINSPANPWLQIRDMDGNVISNRVAAVVIAPGEALGGQDRAGVATIDNFLDSFQKGGAVYSNQDYDSADEDFFVADSQMRVDEDDPSITQPYLFNDQLVYITIDELMIALERRAAQEVKHQLKRYYADLSYYPYATNGSSQACMDNQLFGGLPLDDCSTPGLLSYFTASGSNWFTANRWEAFMYYALSSNCSLSSPGCTSGFLQVGNKTNINALVISTGATLLGQSRPSLDLNDYLDSPENADADLNYDAVGTPLTSAYNDQMFIVAP